MDNRNQQDKHGKKFKPNDRSPNEQKNPGSQDRDLSQDASRKSGDQRHQQGNPPKH